jgi:hypothetical protein
MSSGDGGGDQLVPLLTADNDIDAHLIIGCLDAAGIDHFMDKDRSGFGTYLRGGSDPGASVAILVPRSQLESARQALTDAAQGDEQGGETSGAWDPAEEDAGSVFAAPRALDLKWVIAVILLTLLVFGALSDGSLFSRLIGL